jgi:hypothetical protein
MSSGQPLGEKDAISATELAKWIEGSSAKRSIGDRVIWRYGRDLQLAGASAGFGNLRNLVVIIEGDLTIKGDIKIYSSSSKVSELPSLTLVVTGNIIVDPSVTQIDAILVTNGTFYDCGIQPDNGMNNAAFSNNSTCSGQLAVNGAIVANDTRFQRTYGSRNIFDDTAAEIINYTSAIWLQEYAYWSRASGNMATLFYRETAPRV